MVVRKPTAQHNSAHLPKAALGAELRRCVKMALNDFITYLEQEVANHSIYVIGGQGQRGKAVTVFLPAMPSALRPAEV